MRTRSRRSQKSSTIDIFMLISFMMKKEDVESWSIAQGNGSGILLIHGYTGTPGVMRYQKQFFEEKGFDIEAPLLPGHGTAVEDMFDVRYEEWLECAEDSLLALKSRCENIFIMGLSMGGAIALYLAEKFSFIKGMILINNTLYIEDPALFLLPLISLFKKTLKGICGDIKASGTYEPAYGSNPVNGVRQMHLMLKKIKKGISEATAPLLLFKSREDHVVSKKVAEYTWNNVGSSVKKFVMLENSYHVATLDNDKDLIDSESLDFIREIISDKA